jgi:diguanylate cyclase (GGDEF)-like protein
VARDLTERHQLEAQLAHQVLHDPLTGLGNRALLSDRLQHALDRLPRHPGMLALFFVDLDRFKQVNDSLGHEAGDELLIQAGHLLLKAVRVEDLVVRLGGDEFVVLCEGLDDWPAVETVARRVTDALRLPVRLRRREIFLSASTGVVATAEGGSVSGLLRDADAAMYQAKEQGRGCYAVLDKVARANLSERLQLTSELHWALERDELRAFYQPLVNLATGDVAAVEALVRWQHPDRGLLSPGAFLSVAEDVGAVTELDSWMLRTALTTTVGLGRSLGVWVNLSGRSLADPALPEAVAGALDRSSIDPGLVALEITEGTLMHDAATTVTTLKRLRQLGVQLAIDDFGTGYSSLSYLQQFPVHALKIDISFVSQLDLPPAQAHSSIAIVRAIVSLASSLGLETVAEGIETAEQLSAVTALGCDLGQGYFLSRPAPLDAVPESFCLSRPSSESNGHAQRSRERRTEGV